MTARPRGHPSRQSLRPHPPAGARPRPSRRPDSRTAATGVFPRIRVGFSPQKPAGDPREVGTWVRALTPPTAPCPVLPRWLCPRPRHRRCSSAQRGWACVALSLWGSVRISPLLPPPLEATISAGTNPHATARAWRHLSSDPAVSSPSGSKPASHLHPPSGWVLSGPGKVTEGAGGQREPETANSTQRPTLENERNSRRGEGSRLLTLPAPR